MTTDIYILGGEQTDFARNWSREGLTLFDLLSQSVTGALEKTQLSASDVDVVHIGNFVGELFTGQGMLGGFFWSYSPGIYRRPNKPA